MLLFRPNSRAILRNLPGSLRWGLWTRIVKKHTKPLVKQLSKLRKSMRVTPIQLREQKWSGKTERWISRYVRCLQIRIIVNFSLLAKKYKIWLVTFPEQRWIYVLYVANTGLMNSEIILKEIEWESTDHIPGNHKMWYAPLEGAVPMGICRIEPGGYFKLHWHNGKNRLMKTYENHFLS